MNKSEMAAILAYLYADWDGQVTEVKVRVWFDQFGHVEKTAALAAARLLLSRKTFGPPKVQDFRQALNEVLGEELDWGQAWDLWVKLARAGRYMHDKTMARYELQCPLGARALGSMAREFYDLGVSQMGTFRAQFRQRFEALAERESRKAIQSPDLSLLIDSVRTSQKAPVRISANQKP